MKSDLAALGAVLLWSTLAALGVTLGSIPPLLLTGLGLLGGSLIAIPLSGFKLRKLVVQPKALAIGVFGLLGFHLALFAAFQTAPPVQANLLNYLWPLLIVFLAPLFNKARLKALDIVAGLLGFSGAAVAISSAGIGDFQFDIGYVFAIAAAFIWAIYSLLSSKLSSLPSHSIGSFALVSGLLALALHFLLEPPYVIASDQWVFIAAMSLGPLGGAFYLWDYALKHGNPKRVGLISFATPVLSTALLLIATGEALKIEIFIAGILIVGAAVLGRMVK